MKIPARGELTGRAIEEWVGRTPDSVAPPEVQLRVLLRQSRICPLSGQRIRGDAETHCDHITPLKDGGKNVESNLQIVLAKYHRAKTGAENSERAKVKKKAKAAYGFKEKPTRPMPGSKASGWKKCMDGSVVRRSVPVVSRVD